jgi:hypothetical protein
MSAKISEVKVFFILTCDVEVVLSDGVRDGP